MRQKPPRRPFLAAMIGGGTRGREPHVRHEAAGVITLLGGAAAWPLAARAQQERMRRIGVLTNLVADDPEAQARVAAFLQGLQELGWAAAETCGSISLVRRQSLMTHPQICGGIGRARAGRHPDQRGDRSGAIATSDPQRADRVRAGPRSGRRGLCQ